MNWVGDGDDLCVCGHPEGEHLVVTGACAIERLTGELACGCPRFQRREP
jgi:hypothetical protein